MQNEKETEIFLLASIIPNRITDDEAFKDLKELQSLVNVYGGKVADFVIQRREIHDKGMYLGRGKINEIAGIIKHKHIDILVLNAIVKPGQIYEIKHILEKWKIYVRVWDRVDLILNIFSKHAHTAEAKLQIELASMRHMGPRIYGMGYVLSRQGGGIGTLGIGETNTELMKRHWQKQMKKVQEKLNKLAAGRQRQLERRIKMGLKTVSIIGYTNAGKTSLFNSLTGKNNVVNNALFVTLDSSVGKIQLPKSGETILISDTIGFIQNLPAKLIDAFHSTLLESIHADLLLHVIDISDPDMYKKIQTVEQVLQILGLQNKPRIYVFNKMDLMNGFQKNTIQEDFAVFSPQFISTNEKQSSAEILSEIEKNL